MIRRADRDDTLSVSRRAFLTSLRQAWSTLVVGNAVALAGDVAHAQIIETLKDRVVTNLNVALP